MDVHSPLGDNSRMSLQVMHVNEFQGHLCCRGIDAARSC